jgi:uncharacterized protein YndB with AHSA1/START domain
MQKLHTSIKINAPKQKVWDVMIGDDTYRQWTSVFMPGSYFEGSWEEGSKILFLVSRIAENRLHEFISIEHLGMVEDGVEDRSSEATKGWAGALENYTFKETENGGTEVLVDMDIDEKEKEMFDRLWPQALEKLKELAEK